MDLFPSDADDESHVCLRGSLILADPSLRDPNFARSVLLLTEHSAAEGAHGYVLNRPLDRKVGDVLTDAEFGDLRDVPIFAGGPVSTGQLALASLHWDGKSVHFETHLSAEEARSRHAEGFTVRAFVGYAGWSEGQLESELQQRAWITRRPDHHTLRTKNLDALWQDLLRSMGPFYELLARTPEDPSLN